MSEVGIGGIVSRIGFTYSLTKLRQSLDPDTVPTSIYLRMYNAVPGIYCTLMGGIDFSHLTGGIK